MGTLAELFVFACSRKSRIQMARKKNDKYKRSLR